MNREFAGDLVRGGLIVSATDSDENVRAIELPRHRFFMGTLFIPQLSSTPATPHPVLVAFLTAAAERRQAPAALSGSTTRHQQLTTDHGQPPTHNEQFPAYK
jgi:hypothetical protein